MKKVLFLISVFALCLMFATAGVYASSFIQRQFILKKGTDPLAPTPWIRDREIPIPVEPEELKMRSDVDFGDVYRPITQKVEVIDDEL